MSVSLIVSLLLSSVLGTFGWPDSLIVPCKRNDDACVIKSANLAAAMFTQGIPSLGVDSLEPIRIREVSGKVSNLFLNITNNVFEGYTKSTISDVKLDLNGGKLKFVVTSPTVVLTGHLVVSGQLLDVPVEGDGDYKIITGKFSFIIDANVEKVASGDGVSHLAITTYEVRAVPVDPFKFEYNDLKPKIELTGEALDNFNRNTFLKIVELGSPAFAKKMHAIIFKSVNKFLEYIPYDGLFVD